MLKKEKLKKNAEPVKKIEGGDPKIKDFFWGVKSHVLFHLTLTPTSTDPPPGNSPIIHSRLATKIPKKRRKKLLKIIDTEKSKKQGGKTFCHCMPIIAIRPLTRSFQDLRKWVFRIVTDLETKRQI